MRIQVKPYSKGDDIAEVMFVAFRFHSGALFFWKLFGWVTLVLAAIGLVAIGPILTSYVDLIGAAFIVETDPDATGLTSGMLGKFFLLWTLFMFGYCAIVATVRSIVFRGDILADIDDNTWLRLSAEKARLALSYLGLHSLLMLGLTCVMLIMTIPITLIIIAVS